MNGMAIPATNALPHEQQEANWRAEQDRAYQYAAWETEGARLLGYVEMGEGVWTQRFHEQVTGLPTRTVHQARQALGVTNAAAEQYRAKDQQATQDIARMGLSGGAAQYHQQITRGEALAQWDATRKPAKLALRTLGQVAAEAEQLRATINAAGGKRQRIEAQYQTQLAQLQAEVDAAQLRAAQLGI